MKNIRIITTILCIAMLANCVTTPSSLNDLGEETISETVKGSAMYVGYFGLSRNRKDEVYELALLRAIERAPAGTKALSDVKLWATQYTSARVAAIGLGGLVAVVVSIGMSADDAALFTTVAIELAVALASGLEIVEYTVVGVPVPPE